MDRKPLSVAIIGAGVGGLCLAQGLKASGVATDVFERATPHLRVGSKDTV